MAPILQKPEVKAALSGFAAGLRTFTPPAVFVLRRGGSLSGLGGRHPALRALPVLAAGEYVWDKMPSATSRLEPPAFAARVISGASTGRLVAGGTRGALVGGIAAGLSAPISYHARRWLCPRLGLPDRAWALVEDATAISCAAIAAAP